MHVCAVLLVLWVSAKDYDYVLDASFFPCKYGMHVCLFSVITVSSILFLLTFLSLLIVRWAQVFTEAANLENRVSCFVFTRMPACIQTFCQSNNTNTHVVQLAVACVCVWLLTLPY